MKDVRLNNGVMMPAIGFGVFQIPENETERIVNDAIEIGYRKFDTAAAYFNEEQLGNAIRQSGIKREEFFITTKLWVQDYEYDDALREAEDNSNVETGSVKLIAPTLELLTGFLRSYLPRHDEIRAALTERLGVRVLIGYDDKGVTS